MVKTVTDNIRSTHKSMKVLVVSIFFSRNICCTLQTDEYQSRVFQRLSYMYAHYLWEIGMTVPSISLDLNFKSS